MAPPAQALLDRRKIGRAVEFLVKRKGAESNEWCVILLREREGEGGEGGVSCHVRMRESPPLDLGHSSLRVALAVSMCTVEAVVLWW
jgi:hypothetical protein